MSEISSSKPERGIDWIIASVDVSGYGLSVFACYARDNVDAANMRIDQAIKNLIAGCKPSWIRYKGRIAVNDYAKQMIEALVGSKFQEVKISQKDFPKASNNIVRNCVQPAARGE